MNTTLHNIIVLLTSITISASTFAQVTTDLALDEAIVALFDQAKYKDSNGAIVADLDSDDVERVRKALRQATGAEVTAESARQEAQRLGNHARRAGADWRSKIGVGTWDYAGTGEVGVYAETAGKNQILKTNPDHTFRYSSADSVTGSPAMSTDGRLIDANGRVVNYVQFKACINPTTTYQGVLGDFVTFDASRRSGAPAPIEGRIPDDQFDVLVRRGKIDVEGRLTAAGRADVDIEAQKLALTSGRNGDRAREYLKNKVSPLKEEVRFNKIGNTYKQLEDGYKSLAKASAKLGKSVKVNTSAQASSTKQRGFYHPERPSVGTGIARGAGVGFGSLQVVDGIGTIMQAQGENEADDAVVRRQVVGATQTAGGLALVISCAPKLGRLSRGAGVLAIPLLAASELAVYYQYSSGDMSFSQYRLHCFESGGGIVGGIVGAAAGGALAGAATGSIVPVFGTAVGAGVGVIGGAIVGGVVGSMAGAELGHGVAIAIYGDPQ